MRKRLFQLLGLLSRRDRRKLGGLGIAVIAMGVIEVFGIASIMPFLSVVARPSLISENETLRWLYESMGFETTQGFLLALGSGCLGTLAFANGYTALTHWFLVRFTWLQSHKMSRDMFRNFMFRHYPFFLGRNSSQLMHTVIGEIQGVVTQMMVPLVQIVARGIVALSIVTLVLLVDWRLAVIATLVLGAAYGLIWALARKVLRRVGKESMQSHRDRCKIVLEGLSGIKQLKLSGSEHVYADRYAQVSEVAALARAKLQVIGTLPRYALELVAFGGMFVVLLYLIAVEGDLETAVPTLGALALAAYRLMPGLQQMFHAVSQVRFSLPTFDAVYRDASTPPNPQVDRAALEALPFERELHLDQVSYAYPDGTGVLHGLDLRIEARTTVGIVGSTGSGKTTLIDVILGLLRPQSGVLRVDGVALEGDRVHAWQSQLGYVPQEIFLCDDTVYANIAFGAATIDRERAREAARMAQVHDFVESLPDGYETVVGERGERLSGGQRQRIGIARALYHDPQVLVLDEATSALDNVTEEAIMRAIASLSHQKTIVMIAHRLTTVKACDRLFLIEDGRLAASGTYDELLADDPTFQALAQARS